MSGVAVGVIEQFLHPPLGALGPSLDTNGPYSGNVTITAFGGGIATSDTFGVAVIVNGSIPVNLGYNEGWTDPGTLFVGQQYEMMLFQIVVQHQLFGGAWVSDQMLNSYFTANFMLWDSALPGRLGIWTLPGIAVDLYPLRVL
jgi:hypothetical protein